MTNEQMNKSKALEGYAVDHGDYGLAIHPKNVNRDGIDIGTTLEELGALGRYAKSKPRRVRITIELVDEEVTAP